MLKIFMTGDNHIGLKYAGHERAAQLVEARISAFDRMVDAANGEDCSLFVITGDLFDSENVSEKEMTRVLEALEKFRGTVVVLPGNHDYFDENSKLWKRFSKLSERMDRILLLSEMRPYELPLMDERVVLYPALCTSEHSKENNLGWMTSDKFVNDGVYRIGIAHGAVEGETIDNEGQYYLMKRSELERIPVDVWLIGHTHVPFPKNLKTDEYTAGERIFNAGTHVQKDVHNNTEGCCFLIKIDDTHKVSAKKFISGGLRFYREEVFVKAGEMEETLLRKTKDFDDHSVVELTVSGAVTAEEFETQGEIVQKVLERFLESKSHLHGLTKLITEELIDAEFPETSFSANFLKDLLDEPKEAQLAYDLIKSFKGGQIK